MAQTSGVRGKPRSEETGLHLFLTLLAGTPVPYAELVAAGLRLAEVFVSHGRSVTL